MWKAIRRKFSVLASTLALIGGLAISAPAAVNATPTQFNLVSPVANQKINLGPRDKWFLPVVVNSVSSGWPNFEFTGIFYDSTGTAVLQSTWNLYYKTAKSGQVSWTFKIGLSNVAYVERPVANYLAVQSELNNFATVTVSSPAYSNQGLKQGTYSFELWAMNTVNEISPTLVADVTGISIGKPNGVQCAPGSYSTSGTWTLTKPCIQTSLGFVAATPGSKKQSPVLAGTQGNFRGLSVGTPCHEGNYQPRMGQSRCLMSAPGYFVPNRGAKTQQKCPAGKYTDSSENFSCLLSPPGSFISLPGQTRATPCAAGTFQSAMGAQHCQLAPKGAFVQGLGAISVLLCPPGRYTDVLGSTECTNAPAGTFAYGPGIEGAGATFPLLCSAGYYTSTEGNSACTPADYGYYVSGPGATAPTACPNGLSTINRASMFASDCRQIVQIT